MCQPPHVVGLVTLLQQPVLSRAGHRKVLGPVFLRTAGTFYTPMKRPTDGGKVAKAESKDTFPCSTHLPQVLCVNPYTRNDTWPRISPSTQSFWNGRSV